MSSLIGDTTRLRGWADRLRNRDDSALNELLIHFEQQLTRLTRRMLKDFPDVRCVEQTGDVLQKATVRLLIAIRKVSVPENPRHFLRLAALQIRRELIELAKYYGNRADVGLGSAAGSWSGSGASQVKFDDTDGPSQLAEWTEFHEKVKLLPDEEREVFELVYYGGFSQSVTAEIIGVHPRTVRKRWHGAQLDLFEALDGHLPGS